MPHLNSFVMTNSFHSSVAARMLKQSPQVSLVSISSSVEVAACTQWSLKFLLPLIVFDVFFWIQMFNILSILKAEYITVGIVCDSRLDYTPKYCFSAALR